MVVKVTSFLLSMICDVLSCSARLGEGEPRDAMRNSLRE